MNKTITNEKITLTSAASDVLGLVDYAPSATVNEKFSRLVDAVTSAGLHEASTVSVSRKRQLQKVSAVAEGELEIHWSEKVVLADDPQKELKNFPYLENYQELIDRELQFVEESGLMLQNMKSALVIGSGPLPLSAFFMSRSGMTVDHVDSSAVAVRLCGAMARALGIAGDCVLSDGQSVFLTKQYDYVLIAALAGSDQLEKQAIIDNVLGHLTSNGRIVLRSAKGARELLYPGLNAKGFKGVELLSEYHPEDHVINSVLVYKKGR